MTGTLHQGLHAKPTYFGEKYFDRSFRNEFPIKSFVLGFAVLQKKKDDFMLFHLIIKEKLYLLESGFMLGVQ